MPTHFPTPVMYNSPVIAGERPVKRNVVAYIFYLTMFILSVSTMAFACLLLLLYPLANRWDPPMEWFGIWDALLTFTIVELAVSTTQAIVFGLATFKHDWLLTGSVPLKLSPLVIVPLVSIVIVGTFISYNAVFHVFSLLRLVLYFILAYWERTLPYSYVT